MVRRGPRPPSHLRCATSLKVRSTGPAGPIEMRVIDAGSRWERHATSGPTPSAHANAAFTGDTWLTTTTVRSRVDTQVLTRGVHARRERGERFAPRRSEVGVASPFGPGGLAELCGRKSVELAVIELGPPLVDLDLNVERGPRSPEHVGADSRRRDRHVRLPRPNVRPARSRASRGADPAARAAVRRRSRQCAHGARRSARLRGEPRCGRTARSARARPEARGGSARTPWPRASCDTRCTWCRRARSPRRRRAGPAAARIP